MDHGTIPFTIRIDPAAYAPLRAVLTDLSLQHGTSDTGAPAEQRLSALQQRIDVILQDSRLDRVEAPALFRTVSDLVGTRMNIATADVDRLRETLDHEFSSIRQAEEIVRERCGPCCVDGLPVGKTLREEISLLRSDLTHAFPEQRDTFLPLVDHLEHAWDQSATPNLDQSINRHCDPPADPVKAAAAAVGALLAENTKSRQGVLNHLTTTATYLDLLLTSVRACKAREWDRHRSWRIGLSWENAFGLATLFADALPSFAEAAALSSFEAELWTHQLGLKTFQAAYLQRWVDDRSDAVVVFLGGPFGRAAHMSGHFLLQPEKGANSEEGRWRTCSGETQQMAQRAGAHAWAAAFAIERARER